MILQKMATCGTMESNDIQITLEPALEGGIRVQLTSTVMLQYGSQIEQLIKTVLNEHGVENALVRAVDKGALDCTIRARVSAAVLRSQGE